MSTSPSIVRRVRLFRGPLFLAGAAVIAAGTVCGQQPQIDWIRQFGGLTPGTDSANAVDAAGNVYVIGTTSNATGNDLFVRKYDPSGVEQWTRIFGTTPNEGLEDVAVDASGVIVGGFTLGTFPGNSSAGGQDAVIRKYDHTGNELWTRQFGSPSTDRINGLTILGGDLYLAGSTSGTLPGQVSSGGSDAFLARFDANGTQTWVRQFGTSVADSGNAIRGFGAAVHVTGNTTGALHSASQGSNDVFVRCYDLAGSVVWGSQIGGAGSDVPAAIAVDVGAVHVSGSTSGTLPGQVSSGSQDAFVVAFSPVGVQQWLRQFGSAGSDAADAVAVDASGVHVGGAVGAILPGQISSGSSDAYVRRYDTAGIEVWTRQFGSTAADSVRGLAVGPSGIVACGSTSGTLPGQTASGSGDAFVRVYDSGGNELWTRQFGLLSHVTDVATAVASDGSVYVAGTTSFGALPGQVAAGQEDCFVRKYDAAGTELWTRQFGTTGIDRANGLTLDATGVYVVGSVGGALPGQTATTIGGTDGFIRKYDAAGTEVWTKQFGNGSLVIPRAVAVDGSNLYIAGSSFVFPFDGQPTGPNVNAFVRKCDLMGNQVWTRAINGPFSEDAQAVAVDAGEVYVAGRVESSLDGEVFAGGRDAFVKKYDATGVAQWTRLFGTAGQDEASGLHVDATGVYVCGSGVLPGQTPFGSDDIYLRKYSPSGVEDWTRQVGTPGSDSAAGITGSAGKIYVVGRCGGSLNGQAWAGGNDLFALQYDPSGTAGWTFQLGSAGNDFALGIQATNSRLFLAGQTSGALPGQTESSSADAFVMSLSIGDTIAPIADAGPDQAIHAGNQVYLDGNASNDDTSLTSALTFAWTITSRPPTSTAALAGADTATPNFVADLPGDYRMQLIVTDEASNASAADEVVISSLNLAPTADAGPDQLVIVDVPAQIDGLASFDPDLDPLTWQWTMAIAPLGSTAVIAGAASSTPTFTPDVIGSYEIQLIVSDGFVDSVADSITLVVITAADFAQTQLQDAWADIDGLAAASFDASGHQNATLNQIALIGNCIQKGNVEQARLHLADLITRVDGFALRDALDPKGLGQPNAADFVVNETEQRALYALLLAAWNALSP